MGFGPFLSKEEKARINASMKRNGNGLIQGVGERITPEENERRRRAASPEGMGLTQKDLGVGVGPFVSPAQKIQINRNLRQSQGGAYGPGGSPDGSGRGQARQGVRPVTSQAQKTERINTAVGNWWKGLQTPSVGGAGAMMSGGNPTETPVKPPSYGEGAQNIRAGRSPDRNPPASTKQETPTENPERPSQATGGQETSALTGGRGDTRIDSRGNIQTGTQTSLSPMTMKEANSLLSGGFTVQNPFSSTQLPASSQSPYANVGPVADGAEYARNLEMQKPGAVTGVGPISDGENYAKNVEAGEQIALKPSDTGTDWLNRSAADNSDQKLARRRAFLDAEGSMQGLRRAEATQGIVYAGGQHHMVNPNAGQEGQNDFVSIGDKDDVRGYKSGRLSAQDMKDKYVTKIKDNGITSYDEDKVTDTAGPLADADAYGAHLQTQQDKYKTSGVGPLADGDAYAKMLRR